MTSVTAFCPGHVSCVFHPITSLNPLCMGSRGFGIRLSLGSRATVEPREDGTVNIWLDGKESEARVTRMMAGILAPGMGFDIRVDNDLPVSQGFGMSASGALAASLCIADITGQPRSKAFAIAHEAEVKAGGGLGDVPAIVAGKHIPIRDVAGFPPYGRVFNADFEMSELTLAVLGQKIVTDSVLNDPRKVAMVREVSAEIIDEFIEDPVQEAMFDLSNRFSMESELEGPAIRRLRERLETKGYRAGMCMLGNSIFTDAPESVLWSMLGRGHVRTYTCRSTSKEILITHRE